jgi:hypothetical protein
LIVLDSRTDREHAPSVGTGLSPGDDSFPEPYWYTNPYPRPSVESLPPLRGGGFWNRDGFFGAVLRGSDLVRPGDDTQLSRAGAYLDSAVAACATLARSKPPTA